MSDGREYLHREYEQLNFDYQQTIARRLESLGEFEVYCGERIINSNGAAVEEGKRMQALGVDVTVFNYTIWCYPQYSAVAQTFTPKPLVLFSNQHPSECGMVGMLAAAGTLDQLNVKYVKMWGNVCDDETLDKLARTLRAASVVSRLKGSTFGNFGGRPLGMYTACANSDEWQRLFGVDIENVEQDDIIREGDKVPAEIVEKAFSWLGERVGKIEYDGKGLTPEKLKTQIRSYYGLKNISKNRGLDFVGIKAHGDLTDRYVTMDIAEAFMNDPYDFDGEKEPIVAATEADMDGALTMQIFKLLTGKPVLFADVRHYDSENDVWFFSNSGTHATYFAEGSMNAEENLKSVTLYPETSYYPAGGASVHHFAKDGRVTLARLTHGNGRYRLTIVPAEFVRFDREKMLRMGASTTPAWPVAFAKLNVQAGEFIEKYPCNHIHGVYGDYVEELKRIAGFYDMEINLLG